MSNFRRYIPFFTDFSAYLWAFPKFTIYLFRIKCYNFLTFCHIYIMCFTNKTSGTFILYVVFSHLGQFFFLYIFHNFYLFFLFYKKKNLCTIYKSCTDFLCRILIQYKCRIVPFTCFWTYLHMLPPHPLLHHGILFLPILLRLQL